LDAARASKRFPILARAISRTNPTETTKISSGRRASPTERLPEDWNLVAKEAFCRSAIPLGREHEIDCLTGGVHRAIEILLLATDLYVGFVNPVAPVCWPEIWAGRACGFR